jgi:hypothetical protein
MGVWEVLECGKLRGKEVERGKIERRGKHGRRCA